MWFVINLRACRTSTCFCLMQLDFLSKSAQKHNTKLEFSIFNQLLNQLLVHLFCSLFMVFTSHPLYALVCLFCNCCQISGFLPRAVEFSAFLCFLPSLLWFVAEISGQRTGLIFRDKDAFDILTLEDGTDTLSRNVRSKRKVSPSNNPEERKSRSLCCCTTTLINKN